MTPLARTAEVDAMILGGGPAGAATAIHLARTGRSVALVEQSTAPHHKVCGEFLSREAIAYLDHLGLDLRAHGAVPIRAVRLAAQREISCCDLPFPALSLTRRTLDEALLTLAAESGAVLRRGQRVDALNPVAIGFTAQLSSGEALTARTAFLATGKHDVTSHRRPPGMQNNLVAFKMYFRLAPAELRALNGIVELFLFPGGYAGLQLAEDNQANLCLLVTRTTLRHCNNQWTVLLDHLRSSSDLLAQRLDCAEPLLTRPLALASIPYGMLRKSAPRNLWPLGDQCAVIPSFAGDGISIALHSAHLAADLYARGAPSNEFAQRMHHELRASVGVATTLSRLMIAAPALAHATRLWPALLSLIATHTRIPAGAWMAEPTLARP